MSEAADWKMTVIQSGWKRYQPSASEQSLRLQSLERGQEES